MNNGRSSALVLKVNCEVKLARTNVVHIVQLAMQIELLLAIELFPQAKTAGTVSDSQMGRAYLEY